MPVCDNLDVQDVTDQNDDGDVSSALLETAGSSIKDLRDAAPDVRRVVNSVLRACEHPHVQRRCATLIDAAWRQEPLSELLETVYRALEMDSGAEAVPARDTTPVVLQLGVSRSESDAFAYQRRMERAENCIFSYGTLAETAMDRELVWTAIARRGVHRRGWLEITLPDDPSWVEDVIGVLDQWLADGWCDEGAIASLRDAAQQRLSGGWPDGGAQTVSRRVWTRNREQHRRMRAEIAAVFGADASMIRWMRELGECLPKEVVVQRWVEFRLAHELNDAQAEEIVVAWCRKSLTGMHWHACIHAPAWRDGEGYFQVYVVYAQVELEYGRDDEGVLRNRLTIEHAGRVQLQSIARELWAAGPNGRLGRDALIQSWRDNLANELNQALEKTGQRRRYDAGTRRGRESGRYTQISGFPCTWQRFGDALLTQAKASNRKQGWGIEQDRRFRTALDAMRLLTGMDGRSPEGLQLWDQLERAFSHDEANRADAIDIIAWMQSAARGFSRAAPVESRLTDWLMALVDEPEGARLGEVAARFVRQLDADVRARLEFDTRPKMRALMAQARRWERETAPWRERLRHLCATDCTERGHDADLRTLADDIEERGLTLADVTGERELQWLEQRERWLTKRMWATNAQTRLRQCTGIEAIDAEWRRWDEGQRQAVEELGAAEPQLAAAVRTTYVAARFQIGWRTVVENREPLDLQRRAQNVVQRAESHRDDEFTGTWNALGPGDHEEIRQCAAGDSSAEFRAARERHCAVATDGLAKSGHGYGDPAPLHELQNMAATMDWIARFEPALSASVGAALAQCQRRRATMDAANRSLGITAAQPADRARQVAALTPTQAAGWFGLDPLFVLAFEPPEVREEIKRRLKHFGSVVRRRIAAVRRRASAESPDREVGAVTSEAERITLERFDQDVATVVRGARRRTEEQDEALVRELKQQIEHIRDTRDPETRSALQRSLATDLRAEQVRRSLTRRVWLSLARQGGLGPMEVGDHCRIEAARALASTTRAG